MNMPTKINDLLITAVPHTMVDFVWEQVKPMLQRVADDAPDDIVVPIVYDRLKDGSNMMITVSYGTDIIAVCVVKVTELDSGKKVLFVSMISGTNMDSWQDNLIDVLHGISKDMGCFEIRGLALRKGWLRKLKGWNPLFTTYRISTGE